MPRLQVILSVSSQGRVPSWATQPHTPALSFRHPGPAHARGRLHWPCDLEGRLLHVLGSELHTALCSVPTGPHAPGSRGGDQRSSALEAGPRASPSTSPAVSHWPWVLCGPGALGWGACYMEGVWDSRARLWPLNVECAPAPAPHLWVGL